jgi:hypothetical protein
MIYCALFATPREIRLATQAETTFVMSSVDLKAHTAA